MRTLRYRPAPGQDAAPLVAALHSAGFEAEPETVSGEHVLVISGKNQDEVDREAVRSVIEQANVTSVFDGGEVKSAVRFEGE